jgi:hypothetical protein
LVERFCSNTKAGSGAQIYAVGDKIRHNNHLKYILAASALLLISGIAAAQIDSNVSQNTSTNFSSNITYTPAGNLSDVNGSIDTVILATSETYPDALTAAPSAAKISAPVLLTESDELSEDTAETLQDANVSNVIIVGGPAVVSEDVEDSVEDNVESVTRVWGLTEVGTSAEVATYFWNSADSATVVQYDALGPNEDGYKLMAAAKQRALAQNEPLLISNQQGNMSDRTVEALQNLSVEEVQVYTTGNSNVSADLDAEVSVESGNVSTLLDQIRTDITDEIDSNVSIVAASNYTDVLGAVNVQEPVIYVYPEDDNQQSLESLENTDVEQITVYGDQEMFADINTSISELDIDASINQMTGGEIFQSNQVFRTDFDLWAENQESALEEWTADLQADELEAELENVRGQTSEIPGRQTDGENLNTLFDDAETALENGDLFQAQLAIQQAESELEKREFLTLSDEQVWQNVQEELGVVNVNASVNASQNVTDDNISIENSSAIGNLSPETNITPNISDNASINLTS